MNLTQLCEVAPQPMYVGWAQAICRNKMLSLIFLIPLAELTNQKMGICRYYILYPLRLGPPFPMMLEL